MIKLRGVCMNLNELASNIERLEDELHFLNEERINIEKTMRMKALKVNRMYKEAIKNHNVDLCADKWIKQYPKNIGKGNIEGFEREEIKVRLIDTFLFISQNICNDCVKVEASKGVLYLKVNSFLDRFTCLGWSSSRELINALKVFELINGDSKSYYKSTRFNGKVAKAILINLNLVNILLNQDKAD